MTDKNLQKWFITFCVYSSYLSLSCFSFHLEKLLCCIKTIFIACTLGFVKAQASVRALITVFLSFNEKAFSNYNQMELLSELFNESSHCCLWKWRCCRRREFRSQRFYYFIVFHRFKSNVMIQNRKFNQNSFAVCLYKSIPSCWGSDMLKSRWNLSLVNFSNLQ